MGVDMAKTIIPFVEISGIAETLNKIEKVFNTSPAVFDRTFKDMRNRAPGAIVSSVTSVYGIKKTEVRWKTYSESKRDFHYKRASNKGSVGSVSVHGNTLSSMEFHFKGAVLTPIHFSMTPKERPARKKYKVKAKIKKGQQITFSRKKGGVFLAPFKEGSKQIPWFRESADPKDIHPIKTISLPQMVDNETVRELMGEKLGDMLQKRYNHNLDQHIKRNLK